jgi:hypothetical protein
MGVLVWLGYLTRMMLRWNYHLLADYSPFLFHHKALESFKQKQKMLSATNTTHCKLPRYLCFCTLSATLLFTLLLIIHWLAIQSTLPAYFTISGLQLYLWIPEIIYLLKFLVPHLQLSLVPQCRPHAKSMYGSKLCHCTGVCMYVYINYLFLILKAKV